MDWESGRAELDVRVFGSFRPGTHEAPRGHRETLQALVTALGDSGYTKTRFVQTPHPDEKETPAQTLARCEVEAAQAEYAVFVFFAGPGDPNQTTILELRARCRNHLGPGGQRANPDNTLVLIQEGVGINLGLAALAEEAQLGVPDEWKDEDELIGLAVAALMTPPNWWY